MREIRKRGLILLLIQSEGDMDNHTLNRKSANSQLSEKEINLETGIMNSHVLKQLNGSPLPLMNIRINNR